MNKDVPNKMAHPYHLLKSFIVIFSLINSDTK